MKALSLRAEWAMPVLLGMKTVECRTWKTEYRGDLLICSSANKVPCTIPAHALCIVTLDDIEPFASEHMEAAYMTAYDKPTNSYAWHFSNLRWIEPFENKGKLNLYNVDDSKITIIPETISNREAFERFYMPHVYFGKDLEQRARFDDLLNEIL